MSVSPGSTRRHRQLPGLSPLSCSENRSGIRAENRDCIRLDAARRRDRRRAVRSVAARLIRKWRRPGTPSSEARCIVPVSLVSSKRHSRSSSISCSIVVWPMRLTQRSPRVSQIFSPIAASFFVPKRTHLTSRSMAIDVAASAKRSGNHRFAGPYSAPGQRAEQLIRLELLRVESWNGGTASVPSY